jgi:TonB family protein
MASPAEIARALPDTLPEDFGEWDGEGSPSASPADPDIHQPAPAPAAPPAKAPARTREAQVAAAPVSDGPRKANGTTPVTVHGDNKVYQARMRPVVVDRGSTPAALRPANARAVEAPYQAPAHQSPAHQTPAHQTPAHQAPHRNNGAAAERTRNAPAAQTATLSEADEVLFQSFRSTAVEVEEKAEPETKKWMVIGSAAAAAVVLVIVVVLLVVHHSSAAPVVKQTAEQTPVVDAQESTTEIKPSPYAPTQSTTAKPAAAQTAAQPQAADNETASDSDTTSTVPVQSQMMNDQLAAPSRIPQAAKTTPTEDAPPPSFGAGGMQGLNANGAMGNVLGSQSPLKVKVAQPKIVTVSSGVAVGMLIQKTTPVYPPIAKTAGVSGTVVLDAVISKSGTITDLRVVSGPVMLRKAAEDAVRTWRYRPYKLNNEPTEVETTVNVIFSLAS